MAKQGYFITTGMLQFGRPEDIVPPSRYTGRPLADCYRVDGRRLCYNRVEKVWVTRPEHAPHVIEEPRSLKHILEELERIAGNDYLVWVAQRYNCPLYDPALMKATRTLQSRLAGKVAVLLKPQVLVAFAELRPETYSDSGFCPVSTKVRGRKKRLAKSWKALDELLKQTMPGQPCRAPDLEGKAIARFITPAQKKLSHGTDYRLPHRVH